MWDERTSEFIVQEEQTLELEHSLVALSAWESKWHKSFFSRRDKNEDESLDYIRCMTLTPDVSPETYYRLTKDNLDKIYEYMNDPMTAAYFPQNSDKDGGGSKDTVMSELIYYWMISLGIPPQYDTWHLNKLLALIRVCEIKNQPPKTQKSSDLARSYAALNAARRQKLGTKG
jgi:hypothetical protein